jgi:hypothetical protein
VWKLSSGTSRFQFSTRDELPRISVDPDCRRLAVTGDDSVRLVELASGTDLAILASSSSKLRFAKFLADSANLLTADEAGRLYRWPVPDTIHDLRADADKAMPRALTEDQERRFGLR